MKNLKFLFTLLAVITMVPVFGQSNLTQGTITMELTEIDSDNEQMAAQLEMLKGTQTIYYFNEDKSMVSANMMGGMVTMQSLVNNADEHLTFLFDAMGNKMMVESTKEERADMEAEQAEAMDGVEIVYSEDETKEILGHTCVKASLVGDDMPLTFHMWIAKDIKLSNKMIQGMQALDIQGFPLEYVMEMEQMSMTYSAVEMSDEVDASVFELNTSGYKKMTFEEFQQQMGQFGGGMGF